MTRNENFVQFDYDVLWEDFSADYCELVPLSQRDISIIMSSLRVSHWGTRWTGGTYLLREIGRLADLETALTYVDNLERKLLMTGCLENLVSTLEQIREAIVAGNACCQSSSNPINLVQVGEDFFYGTEQPIDKPDVFGEGQEFETETEFLEHLCSAANNIVSGLILSFNNWSIISLASLLVGGIIVGIFVANPPLGVMIALGIAAGSFAVCQEMANYISDNRQEWVCSIYEASDYSSFLVALDSRISDMVIELDIGVLEVPITELIHSVLDTDTFNKAYRNIGLPPPIDPIDCDVCIQPNECIFTPIAPTTEEDVTHLGSLDYQVISHILANPTRYSTNCQWSGSNTRVFEGAELVSGAITDPGSGTRVYAAAVVDGQGYRDSYSEGYLGQEIAWLNTLIGERIMVVYTAYSTTPHTVRYNFSGDCQAYTPE